MTQRRSKRTTPSVYRVVESYDPSASEDESSENCDESIVEEHQSNSTPFSMTPARLGDAAHVITQSFLDNQGAGLEQSMVSFASRENQK